MADDTANGNPLEYAKSQIGNISPYAKSTLDAYFDASMVSQALSDPAHQSPADAETRQAAQAAAKASMDFFRTQVLDAVKTSPDGDQVQATILNLVNPHTEDDKKHIIDLIAKVKQGDGPADGELANILQDRMQFIVKAVHDEATSHGFHPNVNTPYADLAAAKQALDDLANQPQQGHGALAGKLAQQWHDASPALQGLYAEELANLAKVNPTAPDLGTLSEQAKHDLQTFIGARDAGQMSYVARDRLEGDLNPGAGGGNGHSGGGSIPQNPDTTALAALGPDVQRTMSAIINIHQENLPAHVDNPSAPDQFFGNWKRDAIGNSLVLEEKLFKNEAIPAAQKAYESAIGDQQAMDALKDSIVKFGGTQTWNDLENLEKLKNDSKDPSKHVNPQDVQAAYKALGDDFMTAAGNAAISHQKDPLQVPPGDALNNFSADSFRTLRALQNITQESLHAGDAGFDALNADTRDKTVAQELKLFRFEANKDALANYGNEDKMRDMETFAPGSRAALDKVEADLQAHRDPGKDTAALGDIFQAAAERARHAGVTGGEQAHMDNVSPGSVPGGQSGRTTQVG